MSPDPENILNGVELDAIRDACRMIQTIGGQMMDAAIAAEKALAPYWRATEPRAGADINDHDLELLSSTSGAAQLLELLYTAQGLFDSEEMARRLLRGR